MYVYRWILRNYPEVDRTWICSHIWQFQWVVLTCSSSIYSRMTIVLSSYWNWQLISLFYCTHDQKGVGHLKFLTTIGSCEKKTSLTWKSEDCKNQIWIWEANQWHLNHNISQQMESHQQKEGIVSAVCFGSKNMDISASKRRHIVASSIQQVTLDICTWAPLTGFFLLARTRISPTNVVATIINAKVRCGTRDFGWTNFCTSANQNSFTLILAADLLVIISPHLEMENIPV